MKRGRKGGAESLIDSFEGDLQGPMQRVEIPSETKRVDDYGFDDVMADFQSAMREPAEIPKVAVQGTEPKVPVKTEKANGDGPVTEPGMRADAGKAVGVPAKGADSPMVVPSGESESTVEPARGPIVQGGHDHEVVYEEFFKDREPLILSIEDLSAMLVWGAEHGVSDTFVNSGKPIIMNRYGRLIRLMRRSLEVNEVMSLMEAIRPNSPSTLLSGQAVDTRFDFAPDRNRRYGFRVNATRGMERTGSDKAVEIVLRTIPYEIPDVSTFDIPKAIIDAFFPKDGLILVAGVTGSGKSTLMATLIQYGLQNHEDRLLTYEAPPEFPLVAIPNLRGMVFQCEVGVHVKSFAEGVRNSLRRAPDWIFIGEARDQETIEMTVRAVETGHTVFSTVHTRSVMNTIDRMADEFPIASRWGVKVKLIDAMRLIIYQRLVKTPQGKRVALREYLVFTPEIREALIRGKEENYHANLAAAMKANGCYLHEDAEAKFKAGLMFESDYLAIREAGGAL